MNTSQSGAESPVPPISITHADEIEVRGHGLSRELIGNVSFTQMFLLDLDGEMPSPGKIEVVDAVLVALMEHGITPSTLAGRLILDGAPETLQGAIAGGLLATGSRFLGTIDRAAEVLRAVTESSLPLEAAARAEVERLVAAKERVPGMGHNLHAEVDPRVARLIQVSRDAGTAGRHVEALSVLHAVAEEITGRSLTLNAVGAIGAVLSDLGYLPDQIRGFALVARCAGLFAHIVDEQREPIARGVWQNLHEELNHPS